jgi:hypothetical protein
VPFMYCQPPAAIVQASPDSISGPSALGRAHPLATILVRLKGGVSFDVENDERGNGQEWLFSQHLRKTDHIEVCFAPSEPPIAGHPETSRFAIVGDVETGYFAFVLTNRDAGR